jgi:hypothetical protein
MVHRFIGLDFLSKIANYSFRGQTSAAYLKADATDGLLCPEACNAANI